MKMKTFTCIVACAFASALISEPSFAQPSTVATIKAAPKGKGLRLNSWRLTLGLGATQQLEQTDTSEQLVVSNSLVLLSVGKSRLDFDFMYSRSQADSNVGFLKTESRTQNFELMGRYALTTFKIDALKLAPYLGASLLFQQTEIQTTTPYESENGGTGGFKPDFGAAIGIASIASTFHVRTEAYAVHRQEQAPEWAFGARAILGVQFGL